MSEHYAYIAPQNSYLNLGFYHGTSLNDPDGLLEGTGKKLRHLKIKKAQVVKKKAIIKLLETAISERKNA